MPMPNRREFLQTALAASGALALAASTGASEPKKGGPAQRKLRLLVLGGTGFIGPYVVRYAMERGHSVTLFNRGRTNPHLFPELEKLVGDRDGRIDALKGHEWDAVIDNTGYVPRHVRDSAQLLKDAVGRYLFTSSRMVYADLTAPNKTEDAPIAVMDDPTNENVREHYGPLKALCEQEVRRAMGDAATIVRPTAVAGPNDRSDRLAYWPVRISRGGRVLAPGDQTDPIQYIDVRDLASFMIRLVEGDIGGTFNCAGPAGDLSIAQFLYGIKAITSADVRFTWVPAAFLEQQGLAPREDLPLWTPPPVPGTTARWVNSDRAIAAGLTFRPLAVTALDTLQWWQREVEGTRELRSGFSADREAQVLASWDAAP